MSEPVDHFAWAESAAEQIDQRVGSGKGSPEYAMLYASQGIVHGLLAVADQLDAIRELMDQAHNDEPMDVVMRDAPIRNLGDPRPYPGP